MPNCFTLTPIGQTAPATFQSVDEALCAHLGVTPDPVDYHCHWYSWLGMGLACGLSFEEIKNRFPGDEEVIAIVDWMATNYTSDCWHEHR